MNCLNHELVEAVIKVNNLISYYAVGIGLRQYNNDAVCYHTGCIHNICL